MPTTTFPTTVSAREFQRDYKSVFAKANQSNEPIIIISNNKPQAVVISLKKMDEYNKLIAEQKFWEVVREIQSKNRYNDPITTQKIIDEAVEETRQEIYDKYYRSPRHQPAGQRSTISSKSPRKDSKSVGRKTVRDNYLATNS